MESPFLAGGQRTLDAGFVYSVQLNHKKKKNDARTQNCWGLVLPGEPSVKPMLSGAFRWLEMKTNAAL